MNIYIIEFNEVNWEEDYEVIVSALNKKNALLIADIKEVNPYSSRRLDNIENIKLIGKYYKNVEEEITSANKGA